MPNTADRHLHHVAFDIPIPINYGGAIDIFYKLKSLKEEGVKVHLHCFQYGREKSKLLNELCESVHYYKRDFSKLNFLSSKPYIVASRSSKDLLDQLCKEDFPILFEGLHCCYFLDHTKLKERTRVVRTHNIEHDYYQALAKVEKNILHRWYYQSESKKLKYFEKVLRTATGIAAISKNDCLHFSDSYSHVVQVSAFHPFSEVMIKPGRGYFALYHGSLEVGENNEAALYLVRNVFKDLPIPFIIAGNKPSKELSDTVSRYPHIKIKTNLSTENIYQLVEQAQINILPTFQATGIKLKLLAALYSGRHCIVNQPMIKDTGLEPLCHLANDPEEMKNKVKSLMDITFSADEINTRKELLENSVFSNQYNIKSLINLLFPG